MVLKCLPLDLTLSPPPSHSHPFLAGPLGYLGHPAPRGRRFGPAGSWSPEVHTGRRALRLGCSAPGGPPRPSQSTPWTVLQAPGTVAPGRSPGRRAEGNSGAFCLPFMVKITASQRSDFTKKRFSEIVSSCRSSASLITPRELNNCEHNGTQNHFVCK